MYHKLSYFLVDLMWYIACDEPYLGMDSSGIVSALHLESTVMGATV